jgi:uncharacterized coiled-coil DUF342 family protein
MRIDIYHHFDLPTPDPRLDHILTIVRSLNRQGASIMAKVDELQAELVEINATTNELAADVDDLLAQLAGGLSPADADAVKAKLVEIKTALQATAAKHTPATP